MYGLCKFAGILRESFNLYFFDIYEKISVFDDCRHGGDANGVCAC